MSDTTFTFEYSAYTRHVRGVYLPVTFTVGERSTHLILRVDCAATYGVLEGYLRKAGQVSIGQVL